MIRMKWTIFENRNGWMTDQPLATATSKLAAQRLADAMQARFIVSASASYHRTGLGGADRWRKY